MCSKIPQWLLTIALKKTKIEMLENMYLLRELEAHITSDVFFKRSRFAGFS